MPSQSTKPQRRSSSFDLDFSDDDLPSNKPKANPYVPSYSQQQQQQSQYNTNPYASASSTKPVEKSLDLSSSDHYYKPLPKAQFAFGESLTNKAPLLPDIKPGNYGSLYSSNARYQPMDISSPAAAMFSAPKANKPAPKSFLEDGFPAYKPQLEPLAGTGDMSLIARGVKANDVGHRTDWAAKYGAK